MTDPDDEVDLLIDAWARRLPDVDLSALDVMSRLRRVALNLARIRASAFATAGLAAWEFDVLSALRRAQPPHQVSPAHLIQLTSIGSAAMTNRLTNLADRGLIEREANPRDGRGVLVKPTAEGIARVDAAMIELVRREELELSRVSGADRRELVRVLRALMP